MLSMLVKLKSMIIIIRKGVVNRKFLCRVDTNLMVKGVLLVQNIRYGLGKVVEK